MKNHCSRDPVVIIGGGVAGLAAANLFARNGAVYLALISALDHASPKIGVFAPTPPQSSKSGAGRGS